MKDYDCVIIGAGAAGLRCAGVAADRGRSVLLIDHAAKVGKKVLISGGGRCNFTNRLAGPSDFISQNPHFVKSSLARFSAADTIEMFERAKIGYHERRHGQLFCNESAKQVVAMLMRPLHSNNVEILLNTSVSSVQQEAGSFELQTTAGSVRAGGVVVATGGRSIPKMGATGFGLDLAKRFGLKVLPTVAGLVPFTCDGRDASGLKSLSGVSLEVRARCGSACFDEAMLFTHRGLSGPAMLQLSSYWRPGDPLFIDLLPDVDLLGFLQDKRRSNPKAMLSTVLGQRLPKRLVQLLAQTLFKDERLCRLDGRAMTQVADALHGWRVCPTGTEGYRTAEVMLGGVDTAELSSKTLESKTVSGLYFIGEVVDVTGHLGGFNFQWAWSSAYAAGCAL